MYVQCKVYIHLWRRLKAYNRVIYVQNRPDTCKKLALEKPPLMEPSLENKEALAPTQSDTNSSQYTETEDYSMEVLHVWQLSPWYWLYSYYTHKQAHSVEQPLWKCSVAEEQPDTPLLLIPDWTTVLLWSSYSPKLHPQRQTDHDYLLLSTLLLSDLIPPPTSTLNPQSRLFPFPGLDCFQWLL